MDVLSLITAYGLPAQLSSGIGRLSRVGMPCSYVAEFDACASRLETWESKVCIYQDTI